MRRTLLIVGAIGASIYWFVAWWRRHPRAGAAWVTRVLDPWLIREGVIASTKGELGLIEHVGRKSGTVRVAPIRPVATADGFRIVVPLGVASQWAQNVLVAGHCRLQVGEVVHELDEPRLVLPSEVEELPRRATQVMDWLGFRYLLLHRFAEHPGTLTTEPTPAVPEVLETTPDVIEPVPAEALPA